MTDALPACETLLLERRGRHLHVTLNRPETRNALSAGMVDELGAVIDAVAGDRGLQSLVLRGAGGTFCAGGDISEFRSVYQAGACPEDGPDPIAVSNRRYGRLMARLNGLPQTVVAVSRGRRSAVASGLSAAATLRFAAPMRGSRSPRPGSACCRRRSRPSSCSA